MYFPLNIFLRQVFTFASIGYETFNHCTALTYVRIPNSVAFIGEYAFSGCTSLKTIYYTGTDEEWAKISIGSINTPLTDAIVYYYSEEEPIEEGNFWYYDTKGNIKVW